MRQLARLIVRNETWIFGGPLHGTTFDLGGACPRCGSGARQVGPLLLSTSRLPRHEIFTTLTGEILVSSALHGRLVAAGFQCLGRVLRAKGGEPLPVSQLIPEEELPPFDSARSAVIRERPCPQCGRDGYFDKPIGPMVLAYAALSAHYLQRDLLATFERFGNSKLRSPFVESVLARPALVVGSRFQQVLSAKPVQGIELEPIVVANSGWARLFAARGANSGARKLTRVVPVRSRRDLS